jgi:hypothetical protein
MGLGGDLPGIERDQLMVLPESEWERHKTELTYEGWAAKTMSAEKAGSR